MSDPPTEPPPNIPPPPTSPPPAFPLSPATAPPVAAAEPAKPPRARPAIGLTGPSWVRPVFYYVACLLGILLGAWGALNAAQGVVHLIAPDIAQQGDPITRLATTAVNLIDAGIEAGTEEFEDEIEDAGGEEAIDATDAVLDSTRDELRSQARKAALDELLGGLIFLAIGLAIYRYHWLRVEPGDDPPPDTDGAAAV